MAPGEHPWIPLATVPTPNGYNTQEEPGFIVLKSRGFSCSSNHSLHVEGTARIALNIKLIRFQFEIALLLLFSLFCCSSSFGGVGGVGGWGTDTYGADFLPLFPSGTDLIRPWFEKPPPTLLVTEHRQRQLLLDGGANPLLNSLESFFSCQVLAPANHRGSI